MNLVLGGLGRAMQVAPPSQARAFLRLLRASPSFTGSDLVWKGGAVIKHAVEYFRRMTRVQQSSDDTVARMHEKLVENEGGWVCGHPSCTSKRWQSLARARNRRRA